MLIRDQAVLLRSVLLSLTCMHVIRKSSAGFGSKKFMKGLVLGHALGMKKFFHFPHPHHHMPHMMPHMPTFMPYPVPYPVPPVISPIGSSIATSSIAVATPNALPMSLGPMVGPAVGGIIPTSFAANGGFAVNGLGLAGGAAINPFGLNLLPQGVVSPFGINPFGINAFGTPITNTGTIVNPSGFAFAGNPGFAATTGTGFPAANIFIG